MKERSTTHKAKRAAEQWQRLQESRKIKKIVDQTSESPPRKPGTDDTPDPNVRSHQAGPFKDTA